MTNWILEMDECPQSFLLAAYLDGELDRDENARVEEHVCACPPCAREIREQRLMLATLGAAFVGEQKLKLPEDFARIVAARARVDMRGLRARGERRRAWRVCGVLACLVFALLGVASFKVAFSPLAVLTKVAFSVGTMLVKTTMDLGAGAAVVLRFIGGSFFSAAPKATSVLGLLVFASAVVLLRRLIETYHREKISE